MLERHSTPITVAKVGRETDARWGTPQTASIRNDKKLVDYVRLRRVEQDGGSGERAAASNPTDPTSVARIRVLEEQVRQLTHENRTLRGAI